MLLNKYNLNLMKGVQNMGFTLNQLEQERQIRKLQKKEDKDTKDYEQLSNLPKINNVELKGDKTTGDLGINATNVMMSDGVTSVEEAVENMGNIRMTKLWENPSPTSEFAGQDITGLNISTYDMLAIMTSDGVSFFAIARRGRYTYVATSDSIYTAFSRLFTPSVSNNKITITDCTGAKLTDGTAATSNDRIIPLTIYGIKIVT